MLEDLEGDCCSNQFPESWEDDLKSSIGTISSGDSFDAGSFVAKASLNGVNRCRVRPLAQSMEPILSLRESCKGVNDKD
jgi:hypothetical protein